MRTSFVPAKQVAFSCHSGISLQSPNVALTIIPAALPLVSSVLCLYSSYLVEEKKGDLVPAPGTLSVFFPCPFSFWYRPFPVRIDFVGFVEFGMACTVVRKP